MVKIQKLTHRLAIAVVASVVLAACGGSSSPGAGGGGGGGGGGQTTSPPASPDPDTDADDGEDEDPLEALIAAAQAEGSVLWYTAMTSSHEATAAAFEEQYGIRVESIRLSTSDLNARFAAELDSGAPTADVVSHSDPLFISAGVESGMFRVFEPDELPALADWPAEHWIDDAYAATTLYASGWTYRSDQLDEADVPKTWEEFFEYEGEFLFVDPRASATIMGTQDYWIEEFGEESLTRWTELNWTLVGSAVPGLQQVAAGEFPLIVQTHPGLSEELVAAGAPLVSVTPDATTGYSHFSAVNATATNPNAAALFMNWLMTDEGQTVASIGGSASPLPSVESATLPSSYVPNDPARIAERQARIVELLGLPS